MYLLVPILHLLRRDIEFPLGEKQLCGSCAQDCSDQEMQSAQLLLSQVKMMIRSVVTDASRYQTYRMYFSNSSVHLACLKTIKKNFWSKHKESF